MSSFISPWLVVEAPVSVGYFPDMKLARDGVQTCYNFKLNIPGKQKIL